MEKIEALHKAMEEAAQRTEDKRSNSPCLDCAGVNHPEMCDMCELPNYLRVSYTRTKNGEWRQRYEM